MTTTQERLEYLRSQIHAQCISYGEIAELQGLAEHIDPSDVELLQWAGVPEFPEKPFRVVLVFEPEAAEDGDETTRQTIEDLVTHWLNDEMARATSAYQGWFIEDDQKEE